MGNIPYDCPHCGTKKANFTTLTSHPERNAQYHGMFGICGICSRPIVFRVKTISSGKPEPHNAPPDHFVLGNPRYGYEIIGACPERDRAHEIEALPEEVSGYFMEAEEACATRSARLAALGYRATMEHAIKTLDPDGTGKLYQRIDRMKNIVPITLIEAMHQIRFLGNDAAHDAIANMDDVLKAREFIRLFLIYAFQLPAQIEAAKAKRAGQA
jgi:hypothetical protein